MVKRMPGASGQRRPTSKVVDFTWSRKGSDCSPAGRRQGSSGSAQPSSITVGTRVLRAMFANSVGAVVASPRWCGDAQRRVHAVVAEALVRMLLELVGVVVARGELVADARVVVAHGAGEPGARRDRPGVGGIEAEAGGLAIDLGRGLGLAARGRCTPPRVSSKKPGCSLWRKSTSAVSNVAPTCHWCAPALARVAQARAIAGLARVGGVEDRGLVADRSRRPRRR